MAAIVLIFKAAVNKHGLVVEMAVVAVEDANDSVVIDSRQASRLVHGNKMRQLQFVSVIHIHNRLQATGAAILSVLLYHIARMLEHAERSSELFSRSWEGSDRFLGVSVVR